jgi:hypothetical protein
MDHKQVMSRVSDLNKTHGVTQRGGKKYTQVVHRMEAFREAYGLAFGIDTMVIHDDGQRVVMKAVITGEDGAIIGSGFAEEIRGQGNVNKTSALENCETSAVGRALASIGLSGGEYASANEMDGVERKTQAQKHVEQVERPTESGKWAQWGKQACDEIKACAGKFELETWKQANIDKLKGLKKAAPAANDIVLGVYKQKDASFRNHPQPAQGGVPEPDPEPAIPPYNADDEIPF